MTRSKFALFIDNLSIMFVLTLLSFIFLRSIFINKILCLILSILIGFLVLKIIIKFQNRYYNKLSIKNEEIKNIEKTNIYLRKMQDDTLYELFCKALTPYAPQKNDNAILLNNNIVFYIFLNKDQLSPQDIFEAYKKSFINTNLKEIVIVCNTLSKEAIQTLNNFRDIKITLFAKTETYSFLKKANCLPEFKEENQLKKRKNIFNFQKKQYKHFIKCGILLYISSLFIPYTNYYLITASILLICGVLVYCFGKDEASPSFPSHELLIPSKEN